MDKKFEKFTDEECELIKELAQKRMDVNKTHIEHLEHTVKDETARAEMIETELKYYRANRVLQRDPNDMFDKENEKYVIIFNQYVDEIRSTGMSHQGKMKFSAMEKIKHYALHNRTAAAFYHKNNKPTK